MSDNGEYKKGDEQTLAKYIYDLSKEMNVQGTCGIVGNELELITLVRNCPFLYDKNLPDFKDIRKKNIAWSAIARVMTCKVHEVQQRWRSLREGYNRYKKEMTEDDNGLVRPWDFYEEMKFIEPYIVHRGNSKSNKSLNESYSSDAEGSLSNDVNITDSIFPGMDGKCNDHSTDIMKLILTIKERPVLYDNKHSNYKFKDAKIQAWNEVAQAMSASVNECELKWKNLRERYGRERKIKYVQNDRRPWEYFETLNFLDAHIKPRKHSIFRPILPKIEDNTNNLTVITPLGNHIPISNQHTVILKQLIKNISPIEDLEPKNDNGNINLHAHYDVQHVEFVDATNTSRSRSGTPTSIEPKLYLKNSFINSTEQNQITVHDEDELFGQTISAELRRIPSGKKKMRIKAEIYKILYENESD
ncbi:hypothetical protein FQA39_LY03929 [Lamprigera yunnana]|nr:hypothetical protein FQA39_LY03929 [Lamprigera yunnana]